MKNDWSNGIIVAVTDRKEQADNRNELEGTDPSRDIIFLFFFIKIQIREFSVLPYTPLETLGEEGFDHLDVSLNSWSLFQKQTRSLFSPSFLSSALNILRQRWPPFTTTTRIDVGLAIRKVGNFEE